MIGSYASSPHEGPLTIVRSVFVAKESAGEITQLLQGWHDGDHKSLDALLPRVYQELRRLAHNQLRRERPDHTLQSAALVHEAYVRMIGQNVPQWEGRSHFFAIAAQLMRQILVDYARRHRAVKRGKGETQVALEDVMNLLATRRRDVDVVELDDALKALAEFDGRKARVVELRFFGGLNFEETAEVLNVSAITVSRDWITARAWLLREMSRGRDDGHK
jgi:RNA polymerase sigma factor (TIGR02999 family)